MVAIGREFEETNNILVSVPAERVGKKRRRRRRRADAERRRNTRERRLNTSDVRDFKIPFVLL